MFSKTTTMIAAAVAITFLAGCGAGGTGADPTSFALGSWACTEFDRSGNKTGLAYTLELTDSTLQISPADSDVFFAADYTLVGDVASGTSAEGSNDGQTDPGQAGTLTGVPLSMPDEGERVSMIFESEQEDPRTITAYHDGGKLYLESGVVVFGGPVEGLSECAK